MNNSTTQQNSITSQNHDATRGDSTLQNSTMSQSFSMSQNRSTPQNYKTPHHPNTSYPLNILQNSSYDSFFIDSDNPTTAQKLLHSLYRLMAEIGYERASINKICTAAGVTKSSFYHFFSSKEQALLQLMKHVFDTGFEELMAEFKRTITKETYQEKLTEDICLLIDFYKSNESWRKVCAEIELQGERSSAVKEALDQSNLTTLSFFQDVLQCGKTLEVLPQDFDVRANAEVLLTAYLGLDAALVYGFDLDTRYVMRAIIKDLR